jgi:hypothetical protein
MGPQMSEPFSLIGLFVVYRIFTESLKLDGWLASFFVVPIEGGK